MRISSETARSLPARSRPPWRSTRSATVSAPTLWRVCAYRSPGLPRPITRRSAGVPRRSDARRRPTGGSALLGLPVLALGGLALGLLALDGLGVLGLEVLL